jgi:hypothetical protein
MFNPNICNGNLDNALLESSNPITAPQCRESLGHGFIQTFSRDFDSVSYTF